MATIEIQTNLTKTQTILLLGGVITVGLYGLKWLNKKIKKSKDEIEKYRENLRKDLVKIDTATLDEEYQQYYIDLYPDLQKWINNFDKDSRKEVIEDSFYILNKYYSAFNNKNAVTLKALIAYNKKLEERQKEEKRLEILKYQKELEIEERNSTRRDISYGISCIGKAAVDAFKKKD